MKNSVFLAGTCGNNKWREGCIARLAARGVPVEALFNPEVKDWNEAAMRREDLIMRSARVLLFYLGDPKLGTDSLSFFSLFETMLAIFDAPDRVMVVVDSTGLTGHSKKAMDEVLNRLRSRFPHLPIFNSLEPAEECIIDMLAPAATR